VVRGGFVEASFPGMRMWDATGRLVVEGKRPYAQWHEVLFSSDGEVYALVTHHRGPVELRRVRDDRPLATIHADCTDVFEWSPDDRQLAFVTKDDRLCLAERDGSYRVLGGLAGARDLRFSSDGALIRSRTQDGAEQFWDARRGGVADGAVFRDRVHPHVGRFEHGLFEIADERTNEIVGRIPSDEPLVSDPTGTFWAGRRSHYELSAY
jgi:dipeptidyl aminopeptidase/acylaminoacyl peptidase